MQSPTRVPTPGRRGWFSPLTVRGGGIPPVWRRRSFGCTRRAVRRSAGRFGPAGLPGPARSGGRRGERHPQLLMSQTLRGASRHVALVALSAAVGLNALGSGPNLAGSPDRVRPRPGCGRSSGAPSAVRPERRLPAAVRPRVDRALAVTAPDHGVFWPRPVSREPGPPAAAHLAFASARAWAREWLRSATCRRSHIRLAAAMRHSGRVAVVVLGAAQSGAAVRSARRHGVWTPAIGAAQGAAPARQQCHQFARQVARKRPKR